MAIFISNSSGFHGAREDSSYPTEWGPWQPVTSFWGWAGWMPLERGSGLSAQSCCEQDLGPETARAEVGSFWAQVVLEALGAGGQFAEADRGDLQTAQTETHPSASSPAPPWTPPSPKLSSKT